MNIIFPLTRLYLKEIETIEAASFNDPWSRQMLADSLSAERSLVFGAAAPDGSLAGYLLGCYVLDEGYIDNIAVRPDFRRQGAASLLLSALQSEAERRRLASLTLEVRASNLPAQKLYEKHGFQPVGRRKDYYFHPREDAILMTLEL